jgi:biopolymer transport protein TolR
MAMSAAGSGGKIAQINVTPMIDVLLVLLIIFMVIVPAVPNGLKTLLPQPLRPQPQREMAIVVQVLGHPGASPTYKINAMDVAHAAMLSKLTEIYAHRADRVLFVKGDGNVRFADVADVIDIGKAASVERIGLITPGSGSGQ